MVFILPVRTGTAWWHRIWDNKKNRPRPGWAIRFLRGRMVFKGATKPPMWDTAVIIRGKK